ncbi:MAG: hypothetical protein HFE63_03040 [Clostridiales bacterium]|nr:hypothetical protein [Clostridiales bacterium]
MEIIDRYKQLIEGWIYSAKDYVAEPFDRRDLAYYGTGTNAWGIQTHMKGFSAFAVAAGDLATDYERCGYTHNALVELSLKMLRFTLESHVTGSYHCTDGDKVKWGHHWLAALAIERMMHGIDSISGYMTDHDNDRLREVLISEADYICNERPVHADPVSPNVPESNLWSGALLHRTAMMYPDAARVGDYRSYGTKMLLNSISVPSDRESTDIYAGKPVSEWFVGANFFESYALNHHGYMNVGYMVICLSNIAMLHFSFKKAGIEAPLELYRHFADLWKLVRTCIFDDGRLYRIGGDTRVRYCYCQDYLTPVFALVSDMLGEDMSSEECGWLAQVEREVEYNGDGSFLKERCELFRERSPLYYTRLEGDRACTLSMMWLWHREFADIFNKSDKPSKSQLWSDEYHGSYYVRGENRMAAFTWMAAERPQGSIVPPIDSSMAESKFNLVSMIEGGGVMNNCSIKNHSGHTFDGGFITGGEFSYITSGLLEENDSSNENALNRLVYCALPDDKTVVTLQQCRALRHCWLVNVKPLNLNIPNDIFNGEKREYTAHDGSLTADLKLTAELVYNMKDGGIHVECGCARTIGLNHISLPKGGLSGNIVYENRGMLRVDRVIVGGNNTPSWYDCGEAIFDFGVVLKTDNETNGGEYFCDGGLRAVKVSGADGCEYIVAANFDRDERSCEMFGKHIDFTCDSWYDIIKI